MPARLNLGTALMQKGQLAEAVAELRALLALDPTNAEAAYNLGLALKQQDDFAAAEMELRQAIALDPTLPDAPFTLGVVLWQTGRPDEALQQFRDALARKPDYADAHLHDRHRAETAGRARPKPIAQFKQAIASRPQSAEAHRSLGQALGQQRRQGRPPRRSSPKPIGSTGGPRTRRPRRLRSASACRS